MNILEIFLYFVEDKFKCERFRNKVYLDIMNGVVRLIFI